jgi:hypothetical protein
MQFFILFIGTMVFVFFLFERPPVLFQPADQKTLEATAGYGALQGRFEEAHGQRKAAATGYLAARRGGDGAARAEALAAYRAAQQSVDDVRADAAKAAGAGSDTNYIFLSFVIRYLPAGAVGLIIAVIFAAAMSTISGEVNSLATVTIMDLFRTIRPQTTDTALLLASKGATVFWGLYAVVFAGMGSSLGSLIEAVNIVGSFFYADRGAPRWGTRGRAAAAVAT